MYAQCDIEGNQYSVIDHIVDHRKDNKVVGKDNQHVTLNGKTYKEKTTRGWQLCIEWKDKSTSWERLSDMKESYPVDVAENAEATGISDEPAFSWWTTHVLKKRQRIIAVVNKTYHKMTHQFPIKVPKTVEEALVLDKEHGNDLWWKTKQKEMSAVKVAFKILDDDDKPPIHSQYMKCHMVFSIKMEDFSRKAHLVAGGHMVEAPKSLTFASVVSRESVRITLTLAALNELEVKTSDIQNACLTACILY